MVAAGAILLVCAPVLPGPSRLVVLPALLAPGYALLRMLGQEARWRSVSMAVPASLTIIAGAALLLDVTGIALGAPSLGSLLGAFTTLFLAGTYGRELVTGTRDRGREFEPSVGGSDLRDVQVGEER
jgi:hypothetical protein